MIEIKLEELNNWVQKKFDEKYSQKLQPLKKAFIGFYNLIDQISSLYVAILEHVKKENKVSQQQNDQQFTSLKAIINRSLLIINKMVDDQPASIDMLFCDKFIKIFEANLNLLCTYYHSLSHCDILGGKFKYEKKKIVEGINKLYNLHSKIKELFRNNFWDLRNISSHKKFIASNIKLIQAQRQVLLQNESVFDSFQYEVLGQNQFYDGFSQSFQKVKHMQEPKRSLMKTYFNILHQFYQAQSQLEVSLQPLINYCEQIKLKKKSSSYGMIDTCNSFLRVTALLLKPNYSTKNLKKIKMEDFSKLLTLVTQEYSQHSTTTIEKKKNIEEISECSIFVIDCVKEMDKIESSGLLAVINEYKDAVSPPGSKKFIAKLLEYKKYMSYYYQCHESIKTFQRALQESMFLEFEEKVNLVVTMESSS